MGNTENIHITDDTFQALVGKYLNLSTQIAPRSEHLDQDTLNAFAEGNLSRRDSTPVVNHLADCSFCRNITSELVRLDIALEGPDMNPIAVEPIPAGASSVFSGFLARIFGSVDSTVFAHQEPESEEKEEADVDKKEVD